ncbi:DUF4192 domain-containing protein [Ornithinimicrobium sp. LYQ103]|uniref:DUF4192 domain-containing protein n=1 Tax=Ornithinimicrobium sp. LYQ103 TaxID=3378796 RepID=UPI003853301F
MEKPQSSMPVLAGAAHVLAGLPHLIGYHPSRSLVLVVSAVGDQPPSRSGGGPVRAEVQMTVRLDLPPAGHAGRLAHDLAGPVGRAGARSRGDLLVHAFVFDADPPLAVDVVEAVHRLVDVDGRLRLHDLLLVSGDRYLAVVEREERVLDDDEVTAALTCGLTSDWSTVPSAADVPAVADLVLRGRGAAASREDVAAAVRRRDERASAATSLAIDVLALDPDRCRPVVGLEALGSWVVHGTPEPTAHQRAQLALALQDRWLRDAVLASWSPRLFQLEDILSPQEAEEVRRAVPPLRDPREGALDRLLALCAKVPAELTAPLYTVAGFLAWSVGEGTVANEAVDVALEVEPGYRMATLLQAVLAHGLPPWAAEAAVARAAASTGDSLDEVADGAA